MRIEPPPAIEVENKTVTRLPWSFDSYYHKKKESSLPTPKKIQITESLMDWKKLPQSVKVIFGGSIWSKNAGFISKTKNKVKVFMRKLSDTI